MAIVSPCSSLDGSTQAKTSPMSWHDARSNWAPPYQPIAQSREPVAVEQGSRQVKGNPQVLGLAQQGSRVLDDRVPVRLLRQYHRASHLLLRLALHQALELQKRRIVLKVSPAGSRASDWLQQGLDRTGENRAWLIGSRSTR
jgi:hypothetical protein